MRIRHSVSMDTIPNIARHYARVGMDVAGTHIQPMNAMNAIARVLQMCLWMMS